MISSPDQAGEPLLKTKLSAPLLRAGLVSRPRLASILVEGMHRPLTLVCAPAGYGKTTLLSEWVASLKKDPHTTAIGWLSLDEGDNDPTRFLGYLIAAFETASTDLGRDVRSVLQTLTTPSIQTILGRLINDLYELITPVCLILDDYQCITNAAIHTGMAYFLDRLPQNAHLVIATRSDPPLPVARLRARGQLIEVRSDQLRFSEDEAEIFLRQVMNLPLLPEDMAALENRTEGWIAGLQMAAVAMQSLTSLPGEDELHSFVQAFSGSHRYILDYLAEETLNRQPDHIHNFLLTTSILDRMCGELCDALIEQRLTSSQSILEYLDHANLFLAALDGERHWYRYHPLFADLLRARLNQSQPDRVPGLHERAGHWFDQNGFPHEALRHAFASQDIQYAAGLIERYGPGLWAASDPSLVGMAADLPTSILVTRPRLGLYIAWFLISRGQLDQARPLLDKLAQKLATTDPGLKSQWIESMVALLRAFIRLPATPSQPEALPEYEKLETIPAEDLVLRNTADIVYAMLVGRQGDIDRAAEVLVRCIQREKTLEGSLAIPTAVPFLARIYLMQGRLHEAESLCREFLKPIRNQAARLIYIAGSMKIALGEVLYEWNRLDEAEKLIREGIQDNEAWENIVADVIGLLALARVLQAKGDQEGSMEVAEKLESRLQGHTRPLELQDELSTLKVRLRLASGDVQFAGEWADQVKLTRPAYFTQEHYRLTVARIRLAQGKYAEVEQLLEGLASQAAAGRRATRRLKFDFLLALALAGKNRSPEALQLFENCLSLAEPEGYVRLFLDAGEPARELLWRYLRAPESAYRAYAQRLINAFPVVSPSPPPGRPAAGLLEPLTRRELDVLRLLAGGYSNRQIAEELFLAEGTVKFYVHGILEKLQVHSRTQAIARARELNLI